MGRVFSWAEIQEKAVPKIEDFSRVCEEVRSVLLNTDAVLGAVIFGSAVGARFMKRSDIDCVVVYEYERRSHVIGTLQGLHETASSRNIPIEFIPIDSEVAACGLHSIGRSLAMHLKRAVQKGGVIRDDPFKFIQFSHRVKLDDLAEDVLSYLRHKIRRFEKGSVEFPTMDEVTLYRFLQKVLESPVHIARKILWLAESGFADDSKAQVIRRYPNIVTSRLREIFQTLLDADTDYSRELLEQLHELHEGRYIVALKTIERQAFWALEFARANAIFVLNKFQ